MCYCSKPLKSFTPTTLFTPCAVFADATAKPYIESIMYKRLRRNFPKVKKFASEASFKEWFKKEKKGGWAKFSKKLTNQDGTKATDVVSIQLHAPHLCLQDCWYYRGAVFCGMLSWQVASSTSGLLCMATSHLVATHR